MKLRMVSIFSALVIVLVAMAWAARVRPTTAAVSAMVAAPVDAARTEPGAAPVAAASPTVALSAVPDKSAAIAPVAVPADASPMVHVTPSGEVKYVARAGDTVSQLAIALLGSDSKEHRDAVIAANASLQSDPDRVLEGQVYSIAPDAEPVAEKAAAVQLPYSGSVAPVVATSAKEDAATSDEKPTEKPAVVAAGPKLKYTAQTGDTVGGLATNLLGADTKANRGAIIAGNSSLQQDPDHLVAGKSYTIVAPNGLAANPDSVQAKVPTSQPDADDLARASVGRTLRYTAKPGDTVSKLAVALLGSDTPANRDLIVKSNFSLKQDPDHLVAGQTYWISAPTADATP